MYSNDKVSFNNWYIQNGTKSIKADNPDNARVKSNIVKGFIVNMIGTAMNDYIMVRYKLDTGKVICKISAHNMPGYSLQQQSTDEVQIVNDGKNYKIVLYSKAISNIHSINCHLNAIVNIVKFFNTCVNLTIEVEEPLVMLAMRQGNESKSYYKDIIKDRLGETLLVYNKKE